MDRLDDLAADLPPPRDDEPASLRQDILDELADHLACALDRERQRETAIPSLGQTSRWQRVLDRFGNPSALALRLWREAMQETLMIQRAVSGMAILTMGGMCVALFLLVRMIGEQQQAIAAQQREMAAALQRIGSQSERGTPTDSSPPSIEWVPAEITLTSADPEKAVPPGYTVRLQLNDDHVSMPPWTAKTEGSSTIRFPLVRYGSYSLTVEAPWGEESRQSVALNPGTPFRQTIVCPTEPLVPIVVQPKFVLPADLQQRPLHVAFSDGQGFRRVGESTWSASLHDIDGNRILSLPTLQVAVDGQIRLEAARSHFESFVSYDDSGAFQGIRWIDRAMKPSAFYVFIEREIEEKRLPQYDRTMVPSKVRRLFMIQQQFQEGRDMRCEIPAGDRRLLIEPTEVGLQRLRRLLSRFDKADDADLPEEFGSPLELVEPIPERLR